MGRLCGVRVFGFPGRLGAVAHRLAERPEPGLDRLARLLGDEAHQRPLEQLAVGEDAVAVVEGLELDVAGGADQATHHAEVPDDLLVGGPVEHLRLDRARRLARQRHLQLQFGAELHLALGLRIERVPGRPAVDVRDHLPDQRRRGLHADAVLDLQGKRHQAFSLIRQVAPVALSITSTFNAVSSARMRSALAQSLAARAVTRSAISASIRDFSAGSAAPWNQASGSAWRKPIRCAEASNSPLIAPFSAPVAVSSWPARACSSAKARGVLRSSSSASRKATLGPTWMASTSAVRRRAP